MIFGVAGLYGSGKDTVAELLVEKNFYHFSLSDAIREEAKKKKLPLTRDNLIVLGNRLRETHGPDVLARKALTNVQCGENYVFTSIRNVYEAKAILEQEDAILIKVVAPASLRLNRIIQRGRKESDPKTLKELEEKENIEKSDDPNAQHLHKIMEMATVTVVNDGTVEQLRKKIDKLVKDYLYKLQPSRPDWDEYFMSIAEAVKQRATCLSAKKGAILVKEKRVISTGYNGSPKGITHCNKGGCLRCTNRHLGKMKSGVYADPCICSHSEENAIVQAAVHGISTKGATCYSTFTPCINCAKMLINAEVKEIVAKVYYPDDVGLKLLKEAGVTFRTF